MVLFPVVRVGLSELDGLRSEPRAAVGFPVAWAVGKAGEDVFWPRPAAGVTVLYRRIDEANNYHPVGFVLEDN